jgi:Domain of unknown function (DUF1906)
LRKLPRLRLLWTLTLLALLSVWTGWAAASPLRSRVHSLTQVVRYHGYRLVVPAAWPVYNLAADPSVCARFNRQAVYLGQPSSRQRCPAHAAGRTEAILVEPMAARGASAQGAVGPALPVVRDPKAQPRGGSSTELAVPRDGVVVIATWRSDPSGVARALGVRSVTTLETGAAASPAAPAAKLAPQAGTAPRARTAHGAGDPVYTGLGFDACSTPSASAMSAWAASPYRAVGVYIGGANEACAQPNLSPSWVEQETAAGWVLIPTYVGLQAPSNTCGCAPIIPSQATAEGTAAAEDAVSQAEANGIAPGNPIYDDMEGYSRGGTNTSAVLAYLDGWTTELHAQGYLSGVYSSSNSGITDLVAEYGTGYPEPDDLWIADWNGEQNTSSSYVPSSEWANHQRIHQYAGAHNATYGGVTINIDSDYLDAGAASGSPLLPDGTFVQVAGSPLYWEIVGGAPLFVSDWADVGGAQTVTTITQQQFDALNGVPSNGTFIETMTGQTYEIAGGAPLYIDDPALFPTIHQLLVDQWDLNNIANPWSHLNAVPSNGTFVTTADGRTFRIAGGAPIAVTAWSLFGGVQPSVTIDPWDIADIHNPLAHLNSRPSVGTVVEGLPSGAYWEFGPKHRYLIAPSPDPVRVDDLGLAPFSAIPCRVPNLAHLTLTQVETALMKADCHLGKVHDRPAIRRRHTLRVIKQVPGPHTRKKAYYTVGVTLG